jgi:hypothetical protein
MFDKRLYQAYQDMLQRCYNTNNPRYHRYGGRGITVCRRWRQSYQTFVRDMGQRPPRTTLERRNNDGNYTPKNCYWAPWKEQFRNRKQNHWITIDGRRQILNDWATERGMSKVTLSTRILRGWDPRDAVMRPVQKRKKER